MTTKRKIFYVSGVGEKDAYVATETMVYKDARLTTEVGAAEENEYKYSGEKIVSPKGICELAMFSENLIVTHAIEEE